MMDLARRHGHLLGQIFRYAMVGGFVTALQAATYWWLASHVALHPQLANLCGYLVALVTGFVLHGAVSFKGHGERDRPLLRALRFIAVSLASLAMNAFWVLMTTRLLQWPLWTPIPFMAILTPLLVFSLNRRWVFA